MKPADSTAILRVTTLRDVPAQPIPDANAPKGATMAVNGAGAFNITARIDGPASKVNGEIQTTQTFTNPQTTPPSTTRVTVKVLQTIDASPVPVPKKEGAPSKGK